MSTCTADRLRRYLAAYEAKDLAAIEAMLSPQVRLQDWNLAVEGRAAVLAETLKNFQAASSLSIQIVRVWASPYEAAAQLRIQVNRSIELEVVDILAFDAQGRITAIRAFKG